MPTSRIVCPHCSAALTTGKQSAAGGRFRCPHCDAAFTAQPADAPPERRGGWLPIFVVVGAALLLLLGSGAALVVVLALPTAGGITAITTARTGRTAWRSRP